MQLWLRNYGLLQKQFVTNLVKTIPLALFNPTYLFRKISSLGLHLRLEEYDKRKLRIFNQLNFFQLVTGIFIPLLGLTNAPQLPPNAWMIAMLPAVVSLLVLYLNRRQQYQLALLVYFILYPFFTCIVYINGMSLGMDAYFILYGVLSVFFLHDLGYMLFTVAFSMLSYFILVVVLRRYQYHLEAVNKPLYLLNQFVAIGFVYYGLLLLKKESNNYQWRILRKNRKLHERNSKIRLQKQELADLNAVKTKLFSVIAHDLKVPLYGLHNLFRNMQQQQLPPDAIKELIPEVVHELQNSIGLMENLLQWARSQMQAHAVNPEALDADDLIADAVHLLRRQAEAKQIQLHCRWGNGLYLLADREMMAVVLRNLLSNAIKFTPQTGTVCIGVEQVEARVTIFVADTGQGMSAETLEKVQRNEFYSSKGTASEGGTGLGLLLCREFVQRNGGTLSMESTEGKGSRFSFSMPVVVPEDPVG